MATFLKQSMTSTLIKKAFNLNPICVLHKRFLRVDPEEEIERLFISKSFDQRLSSLQQQSILPPTVIGNGKKDPVVTTLVGDKEHTTRASRARVKALLSRIDGPVPICLQTVQDDSLASDDLRNIQVLYHYNIFQDLFQDNVMFYPDQSLQFNLGFALSKDDVAPVYFGNKIDPHICSVAPPLVGFKGKTNMKYSLLLVNIDGHLSKQSGEYLHWSCGR